MLGSIHGVLGVGSSGDPGGWGSIGGGDGVGGEDGDGGTGGGGGGEGCGTSPDEASSVTSMPPPEEGSRVRRRSGTAVIGLGLGLAVMGSSTPRAGRAQPLTSVTAVEMQPSELKARSSSSQ